MGLFLKKVFVYLVVLVLFTISIQALISYRISGVNVSGNDNLELYKGFNADIVFLGSSRARSHFDPKFFAKEYNLKGLNLGMQSRNELTLYLSRLKDYLSFNHAPKFIIINLDPHTNGNPIDLDKEKDGKAIINKNNFSKYSFIPFNTNWKTIEFYNYNNFEKYVPLFSLFKYNQIKSYLFLNESNFEKNGYYKRTGVFNSSETEILRLKKGYEEIHDSKNTKLALEEFSKYCKELDIDIIAIQTPVINEIYSEVGFNQCQVMCKELNIPIINTNVDYIITNTNNFEDGYHLNRNGVVQMNEYFIQNKQLDSLLR
ncbi:hypothetical protein BN863_4990 [Formosa agariphila KMM 3901]|uniref:SGNH/GDSL hydrolase family protein n=1 Tax=Formosa agariphila (strain DSM 15362 / KCTC 12365 / LMG 23005 / KMM 3901 / M-2Alg 35-1) TaxID=1347342 RepID=T2KIG2_FORAG|nr:hypothetical protein [Formosa agariphila]CDF78211.1 hypothetical protein BN863_4990 [Formosa agariphila KMM 3901]